MSAEYFDAPEVEVIAKELIEDHHPNLCQAKIKYLFRTGDWESKGKTILGKAEKLNDKIKHLAGYDFIITINQIMFFAMTPQQRRALVDHELTHCFVDEDDSGNPVYKILPHDVEEFHSIIRRHGLWQEDLRKTETAMEQHRQLSLFKRTGTEG
ncbi:putative metallopeptidase [Thermosinus carboxydivorans]|nr:putative metallopeptidase [Thermosinus carboxydivorans]